MVLAQTLRKDILKSVHDDAHCGITKKVKVASLVPGIFERSERL